MTDARVKRNISSVRALERLLCEIIATPVKYSFNQELKASLSSQGALAKYDCQDLGIFASSINTLKRIANDDLKLKFFGLDKLRKDALQALELYILESAAPKEKRRNYEDKFRESERKLSIALQDLWLTTAALDKSLRQGRYYAEQSLDPDIVKLCHKEQQELRDMLGLRTGNGD